MVARCCLDPSSTARGSPSAAPAAETSSSGSGAMPFVPSRSADHGGRGVEDVQLLPPAREEPAIADTRGERLEHLVQCGLVEPVMLGAGARVGQAGGQA